MSSSHVLKRDLFERIKVLFKQGATVDEVQELVQEKRSILKWRDAGGRSLLHWAVRSRHCRQGVVHYLVKEAPKMLRKQDADMQTPHFGAVETRRSLNLIQYLIEQESSALHMVDADGFNLLDCAIYFKCSLALIKYLVNIHRDLMETRPWDWALSEICLAMRCQRSFNVIRFLIEQDEFVLYHEDIEGWNLLHCAIKYRCSLPIVRYLCQRNPDLLEGVTSLGGRTPLHLAVRTLRSSDFFEEIEPSPCSMNVIDYLIDGNPDAITVVDFPFLFTPLHIVCLMDRSTDDSPTRKRLVTRMLDVCPHVATQMFGDYTYYSMLHWACEQALSGDVIEALLKVCPEEVFDCDSDGLMPLEYSCMAAEADDELDTQRRHEAAKLILKYEPSAARHANDDCRFPLHTACFTLEGYGGLRNGGRVTDDDDEDALRRASPAALQDDDEEQPAQRYRTFLSSSDEDDDDDDDDFVVSSIRATRRASLFETIKLLTELYPVAWITFGEWTDVETGDLQMRNPYAAIQHVLRGGTPELEYCHHAMRTAFMGFLDAALNPRGGLPHDVSQAVRQEIKEQAACESSFPLLASLNNDQRMMMKILNADELIKYALIDEELLERVELFMKMNRAGREYFVDDPTNCVRALPILEMDCLDSIWIHLRENPRLCCSRS